MRVKPLAFVSHSQSLAMRHKPPPNFSPDHTCDLHLASSAGSSNFFLHEIGWSPAALVTTVVAEMEQVALALQTGGSERI